jgi:hypothetical protein
MGEPARAETKNAMPKTTVILTKPLLLLPTLLLPTPIISTLNAIGASNLKTKPAFQYIFTVFILTYINKSSITSAFAYYNCKAPPLLTKQIIAKNFELKRVKSSTVL